MRARTAFEEQSHARTREYRIFLEYLCSPCFSQLSLPSRLPVVHQHMEEADARAVAHQDATVATQLRLLAPAVGLDDPAPPHGVHAPALAV